METLMSFVNSSEEMILASNRPKRSAGGKKFTETRHPVYRCVRRRKNDKWVCEVREPNKKSRLWLGTYETAEMAARAYDVAALALSGRSTCLNFADSIWRLPIPVSGHAKDIQKAAAEAAELCGPNGMENLRIEILIPLVIPEDENFWLADNGAEFGMVGLLECMAEGLLLPPPPHMKITNTIPVLRITAVNCPYGVSLCELDYSSSTVSE